MYCFALVRWLVLQLHTPFQYFLLLSLFFFNSCIHSSCDINELSSCFTPWRWFHGGPGVDATLPETISDVRSAKKKKLIRPGTRSSKCRDLYLIILVFCNDLILLTMKQIRNGNPYHISHNFNSTTPRTPSSYQHLIEYIVTGNTQVFKKAWLDDGKWV